MLAHKKAKSGFTLIELLVVIAIIGVLATIVLASLNNARRKARDARRITDLKQIGLAIQLYIDGAGSGQVPLGDTDCTDNYGLQALVTSGYIPTISHDPSTQACYRYASGEISGNRSTYHLTAVLEDATNLALTGDKDCSSDAVGTNTPKCDSGATWAGAVSNGVESVDCVADKGGAGTDQCYDVTP